MAGRQDGDLNEIIIKIWTFSFMKMCLIILFAKCRPLGLGLSVLKTSQVLGAIMLIGQCCMPLENDFLLSNLLIFDGLSWCNMQLSHWFQ